MSSSSDQAMAYRHSSKADKGMRRYMEDITQFDYEEFPQKTSFFAVFDGHGGREAARFARRNLWKNIKNHPKFNSEDSNCFKEAIKEAFITTHKSMENDVENWPTRKNGMQSTSGTTVTCAILRGRTLYVAQLGDSGAVLGRQSKTRGKIEGKLLTTEHKPESPSERTRIEEIGGSVADSNGTCRVVWKRPIQKQIKETPVAFDYIPFLAVSRSLGDLWSYNEENGLYIISPVPEITSHEIEKGCDEFIVLGTDGLWGMLSPKEAVNIVKTYEEENPGNCEVSSHLVKKALNKWVKKKLRADNISAMIVFFDEEGENSEETDPPSTPDTIIMSGEDNDEETPPDVMIDRVATEPKLVRETAGRWIDLESLARRFKGDCSCPSLVKKTGRSVSDATLLGSETPADSESDMSSSLKRKSSVEVVATKDSCKRSRTLSGCSTRDCCLKTNVSSKSIENLHLDLD